MSVRIGQKTITYKKITKNFRLRNWPYFVCFVLQNLTSNISLSRWEKFRGLFQLKIRGLFFLKFSFWAYKKPNYYTTYSHTIFFIISLIMTLFLIVRNPFFIFFYNIQTGFGANIRISYNNWWRGDKPWPPFSSASGKYVEPSNRPVALRCGSVEISRI